MQNNEQILLNARAQFQSGQLEAAFDSCALIIKQQPNHAEAHFI